MKSVQRSRQLRQGESLPRGLRRVLLASLDTAARALDGEATTDAVHRARIELKRARAVLRLFALADRHYVRGLRRRWSAWAARLAPQRDRAVAAATACDLADEVSGAARRLAAELGRLRAPDLPGARADACRQALAVEARRLRSRELPPLRREQVAETLRRNFQRARRRATAKSKPPSRLHAWRKSVILLREQVGVLQPRLTGPAVKLHRRLRRVARELGAARDLQLLLEALPARAAGRTRLHRAARQRQKRHVARACRHWGKARRHWKRVALRSG